MRTTFFALLLAGFLSLFVAAQESEKSLLENEAAVKEVTRQLKQAYARALSRADLRLTMWDYPMADFVARLDIDENMKQDYEVTEWQYSRIREIWENFEKSPGDIRKKMGDQWEKIRQSVQDSGNFPEEWETEYMALLETFVSQRVSQFEEYGKEIEEILTTEQKQKFLESEIAAQESVFVVEGLSESLFVNPHLYEAFDLTNEQRKQLEEIKKELEPEFERLLDRYIDWYLQFDELEAKFGYENFPEEATKELKAFKECLPKLERDLGARLMVRTFEILTDEQRKKLTRLLKDLPDDVKKMLAKTKTASDEQEKTSGWQPGPNSWKPGDPIPEGYLQQREERTGRFPRTEQSDKE